MKTLGRHVLLEFYECDEGMLNDVTKLKEFMNEAARMAGATIMGTVFHKFNPIGVSGVVVIAESHLSIHTWPEHRYAAVDIFTCGKSLKPEAAAEYLAKKLKAQIVSSQERKRGIFVHDPPKSV